MSYLVFARKFRPQTFAEVSGQEHVTRTLANSIKRGRIAHAYLFAGPRGVGKTSVARIFAKSLNCEMGEGIEPCGKCSNCLQIAQGIHLSVREIDGASHNSVDNVRELIETFRSLPAPGTRYKMYIIDEVHMLSTSAFNALLKSLEEPPPHTVFVLATTEAHKIPETVISRCQRHDFRALGQREVEQRLQFIANQEGIEIEPAALRSIAALADGSMRDGQSLLDRVHAFCDGAITAAEASRALGTVSRSALFEISRAIFERAPAAALSSLSAIFSQGADPGLFMREFVHHFRELLIAGTSGAGGLEGMGLSEDERVELMRQAGGVSQQDLQDLVHLARTGCDEAVRSSYPKYAFEALVVRLATREPVFAAQQLLAGIDQFLSREGRQQVFVGGNPPGKPAPRLKSADPDNTVGATVTATVTSAAARPLDWSGFVRSLAEEGSKVLAEHLKRVAVVKFEIIEGANRGRLEMQGPDFTVASLKESSNKSKLEAALAKFTGIAEWNVRADTSKEKVAGGSLYQQEQVNRERDLQGKKEDLVNHPKIRSLQKAFPGSKIEEVKIRE